MSTVDSSRDHLADSLLAVARAMAAMAIRTAGQGPVPLTVVQHRVLLLLEDAGTLSVNAVAARLGVDQSNASRHCTRLAELELVDRTPAPHDRRSVQLRLTSVGRRQVLAVDRVRREWVVSILDRLTDDEAREAVRGMGILAEAAATADQPAPLF